MRDLDVAVLNALNEDQITIAILGEFQFESGTQYFWAGPEGHVFQHNGNDYVSIGDIGEIDKIAEAQGLADARTTVALWLTSENIDVIDVEDSRGNLAIITLLILSDQGAVIGEIPFVSTMGKPSIQAAVRRDQNGGRIVNERLALELLSETSRLARSHFVRTTYEAGLRIDSDDHGLEFVSDPEAINLGLSTRPGPRGEPRGPRHSRR